MDGRLEPNPQPENENDMDDNAVIDLTQIVEREDDDDIIELRDILDQPDRAPDAADEGEESVITLTDAIPAGDSIDLIDEAPDEANDDIIELTDMATTIEADLSEPQGEVPTAQTDEGVIDLMDLAEIEPLKEDRGSSPLPDDSEDVIDLLDAVEPMADEFEPLPFMDDDDKVAPAAADTAEAPDETDDESFNVNTPEEAALTAGPDAEFSLLDTDDSATGAADAFVAVEDGPQAPAAPEIDDLDTGDPAPASGPAIAMVPTLDIPASEPVPLSDLQMEQALERVIEKVYGERIEGLMIQAIEKTVKQEIAKIKHALTADDDDLDE